MKYQGYAKWPTKRKVRKQARRQVFQANKELHSSRAKEAKKA